jgi:hypothetical protein
MPIDSIIKLVKALKPNQCYLIGGSLVFAGLAGTSSPFWYPLVDDVIRNSLNLAIPSEDYSASKMTIIFSVFSMLLGALLIILNRILDHKEQIATNIPDNIVEFQPKPEQSAFEADSGGSIIINGGKVKNYTNVAKASNKGVVTLNQTVVEKENE